MKIAFDMSSEYYDPLLMKVPEGSIVYTLLKNAIVTSPDGPGHRIIQIACEPSEAEALLGVAQELWPEAANHIKEGIRLALTLGG